jgi:hypothetical protein
MALFFFMVLFTIYIQLQIRDLELRIRIWQKISGWCVKFIFVFGLILTGKGSQIKYR